MSKSSTFQDGSSELGILQCPVKICPSHPVKEPWGCNCLYSQVSFSKICPPERGFMNPTVSRQEISQGKVVQIGDYPRDWSQDSPLAGTAQIRLQLLTKDGHQSALERVSPGKTNLNGCFCVLSYRFILKEKKHGKKAYIFAYLWYFYSK